MARFAPNQLAVGLQGERGWRAPSQPGTLLGSRQKSSVVRSLEDFGEGTKPLLFFELKLVELNGIEPMTS